MEEKKERLILTEAMFKKKVLFVLTALVFLGFISVSTAKAEDHPQCYTVASLEGTYAIVQTYGPDVAIGLALRYFDGKGNLKGASLVNEPTPGSSTGSRTIVTTTQVGTYTVNCDGTGVFSRIITASNGVTAILMDDFLITRAAVKDGRFIATALEDVQRTPSVIVPGGIFLKRSYTRRPDGTE